MNLHLTWDNIPGANVTYTVEYRVYQSGNLFTVFASGVTTNYITIPGVAQDFYEARVKPSCSSEYIYDVGGQDSCLTVQFNLPPYEVLEDTDTYQRLRFTFTNIVSTGATIKVTNINTSTIIFTGTVASKTGTITIDFPKTAGQTIVYKVEIANLCAVLNWQNVGEFPVSGPPAKIMTTVTYASDFCGGLPGCASPGNCSKPNSGLRFVFAEPTPQSFVLVFDLFRGSCTGVGPGWYSDTSVGGSRYLKITVPAGVTTYGFALFRDGANLCAIRKVCVVSIIPSIFNNGKKLEFQNAAACLPIKNIPIVDANGWKGCIYST